MLLLATYMKLVPVLSVNLPYIHFLYFIKKYMFNEFNQIVNLFRKLLCMWGSTYCCEQFFSCMKNIKTAKKWLTNI